MALVRGACPHDCPDTCAFHVTVEDGRATKLAGRADHPITAGFLCGKVSDYLERVYSPERLLHPLIRTGAKGSGEFRRATWDEALDAAAAGIARAIERHGPESVLPYSYLGTMGVLQGGAMADRFMAAVGARTSSAPSARRPAPSASASRPGSRPRSIRRSGRTRG